MPKITINPGDALIDVPASTVLSDALQTAGVLLETPCGGQGTCGRCRVRVTGGSVPETPHDAISEAEARQGVRLACRAEVGADLTVELLQGDPGEARILRAGEMTSLELAPAVTVVEKAGVAEIRYDRVDEPFPIAALSLSFRPKGLAIDIGTTTLVVGLYSLEDGRELATASALNPQIRYGHDVLSRIQKGSSPEGLAELAEAVRAGINGLVRQACLEAGVHENELLDAVLGGNTTMLQLAAGIDPKPLGRAPFTVGIQAGRSFPPAKFGLAMNPAGRAYVPPVIHANVGSDITAGLLACRFSELTGPVLFIDLGTNGEMAVQAAGRVFVTATAAGPAFEGMGVACGMRATTGAIEDIRIDGDELRIRTVGGGSPRGICGSGILDAVACLLRLGVLLPGGRMVRSGEAAGPVLPFADRLFDVGGKPAFRLAGDVFLTQEDVRQVQLAKGAIRAGIDLLLQEVGVLPEEVTRVILAGGFGYHLRTASLVELGLLPAGLAERVAYAGNTSQAGSIRLLLNVGLRRRLEEESRGFEFLSLAHKPAFRKAFVSGLSFPEALPSVGV